MSFTGFMIFMSSFATAHPVPFSYLDIRIADRVIGVGITAHIVDVAHDLGIEPADRLLDAAFVKERNDAATALLRERLRLTSNGRGVAQCQWSSAEILAERQSLRWSAQCPVEGTTSQLTIDAWMFPYDPQHQTFVNVYDGDRLRSQIILDSKRHTAEYFSDNPAGIAAVVRTFVPAGVHHILIGPDHLLFLVGLLLLGGSLRRLALIVTAFTVAHSLTLSLAVLNVLVPPSRVIEPAIALSIIYVGADNLMAREGRDMRAWIALGFGLIHGFGFASVLREMGLPGGALGWSLFSFNAGVEIGQLIVVVIVGTLLAAVRSRSEVLGRRLAVAGSLVVIAAGTFWFVQRLFFGTT
jgi:hydrogenase/urease accessory protein HupE